MPPQIILTQWGSGTTYEDIVAENRYDFDVSISLAHGENDVYHIGPHVHVFGPIVATHYLNNPSEFACRYLTADIQKKVMGFLPSEDPVLLDKAKTFGQYIGESKLTLDSIGSGWLPLNHEIVFVEPADYNRAIAKIAFHCYLHRIEMEEGNYRERYIGNEDIFEGIRGFIHNGECDEGLVKNLFQTAYTPLAENVVPLGEVAHVLRFLENEDNLACVIEFFGGTYVSKTFTIILAGCYDVTEFDERHVVDRWLIRYKVPPKHPMVRSIIEISNEDIRREFGRVLLESRGRLLESMGILFYG